MASVPDTSHLPWWLGPSKAPWEAMIEGIHAGSQIRANQIQTQRVMAEAEQNLQRQETNTQLKLMDLGLESERNDLAKKAFSVRQNSDLLRAKGMAEIGDYLSQATATGMLTDPDTQAGFWSLTSKYAPFINEATVNSMWDNTFKAASDRDERAKGLSGKDQTAAMQNYHLIEQLKKAVNEAPDAATKAKAQESLDEFRHASGVFAPNSDVELRTIVMPDGTEQTYYPGRHGEPIFVKSYDPTKITDKLKLVRFQSAVRTYDKMWADYDPLILSADGKSRDPQKLIALKDRAYQEAVPGAAPNKIDTAPATTKPTIFRYDPATDKLVPK